MSAFWSSLASRGLILIAGFPLIASCSSIATNAVADALSGTGTVFAGDDDPELIEDAAPFGLKTMEAVLVETPKHEGLLLALVSGYTQYAYAFLAEKADRLQEEDFAAAQALTGRARKLYLRALGYGLRGLEVRHEGFEKGLRDGSDKLFERLDKEKDVPFLYWTGAAWGLSIAASDFSPDAIADFPLVDQLARWALALDEQWDDGTLHAFMVTLEASRPGGDLEEAERHFERALALDGGRRAGTFVSMAEGVCIKTQDVIRFHEFLDRALEIDVEDYPAERLVNVILQRRAAWLKAHEEDFFIVTLEEARSAQADGQKE